MPHRKLQGAALEQHYEQRLVAAESEGRDFDPTECMVSAGYCREDPSQPHYTGFYQALFAHRRSTDDPVRAALFDAISDTTSLEDWEIEELMDELPSKGIATAEEFLDAARAAG